MHPRRGLSGVQNIPRNSPSKNTDINVIWKQKTQIFYKKHHYRNQSPNYSTQIISKITVNSTTITAYLLNIKILFKY
jgi:hypothetical protein